MPQMNKGGKFIFGESVIHTNGLVHLPPQAIEEYRIAAEGKVYLFTGSKSTTQHWVCLRISAPAIKARTYLNRNAGTFALRSPIRYIPPLQRARLLLDRDFGNRSDSTHRKNAEFSAPGTRIAALIHPQQRYRPYHGGKRTTAGTGRTFPGRNSSVLKNKRSKSI